MTPEELQATLERHQVHAVTRGPNVRSGQVGIACPFCGDDPSQHMTINVETEPGLWGCWRDKSHSGSGHQVWKLFVKLGFSKQTALDLQKELGVSPVRKKRDASRSPVSPIDLTLRPPEGKVLEYLRQRWTYMKPKDVDQVIANLNIGVSPQYPFRAIVPIYEDGLLVNFVARAAIPADTRYMMAPKGVGRPGSECLFSLTYPGNETLVVCEGVFDAISANYLHAGMDAVSTLGCNPGRLQTEILMGLVPHYAQAWVWYDRGAELQSMKLARAIGGKAILHYDGEDPEGVRLEHLIQ